MQADFWHERWQQNQIGFHQAEVHASLKKFWATLQVQPGSTVFVPLCGKSLDLLWLRDQGYRVIGIELSPLAVESFFAENQLTPKVTTRHGLEVYEAGNIRIYCGDFFELDANHLPVVHAIYDRAALIALPASMRQQYVQHLLKLMQPATQTLLITVNYVQSEMPGPPFSVSADEVTALYAATHAVTLLQRQGILQHEARFRERGVSRFDELVFHLQSHPAR